MKRELFFERGNEPKSGLFCLLVSFLIVTFTNYPMLAYASDGATEALQLRYQAELAIAQEQTAGHAKMAKAMKEALPGLLQEYLVTRDGTIALDTVDAAFVQEQFKVARAMEEPGVALALDVFSGSGTGYEHELRSSISKLADFHSEAAERVVERNMDRETAKERVSERTLDSYEKVMEREMSRQVEKFEHELAKTGAEGGRLDGKFEAKMEARLDTVATKFEHKIAEEHQLAAKAAERAEHLTQEAAKMTEMAKAIAETNPEKAEKLTQLADKLTSKAEKAAEKVEEKKADQAPVVEKVLTRVEQAAEAAKQQAEEKAKADAAATERAARGAELEKQRAEERAKADAAAAARRGESNP